MSPAASWAGCSFSAERYALLRARKFCGEWGMERRWNEGNRRILVVGCTVAGPGFNDDILAKMLLNGCTYLLAALLVGMGRGNME